MTSVANVLALLKDTFNPFAGPIIVDAAAIEQPRSRVREALREHFNRIINSQLDWINEGGK